MVSPSQLLTAQFYEWECKGRGWAVADFPCDLEPPFVPFWGHYIETGEIIDDGKRQSFWEVLFSLGESQTVGKKVPQDKDPVAHPYSGISDEFTLFTITLPKHFKQHTQRITEFLVMLSYRKSSISFEIVATVDQIILQYAVQDSDAEFFYGQLRVFFPDCGIIETHDDLVLELLQSAPCLYTVDFGLAEEFMRPIAARLSDNDPYTALFGMLDKLDNDESVIIQVLFSGVHNAWAESIVTAVSDDYLKGSFFLDAPEMPQLAREKVSAPLFAVTPRLVTISDTMERSAVLLQNMATALVHASSSHTNSLLPLSDNSYNVHTRLYDIVMRETHRVGMLLNVSELATLVHFPGASIQTKKLVGSNGTTKAAPPSLTGHPYCLGLNVHQGATQEVSLSQEQRLRHIHIMGATGTGKSTLLQSLIMQDIQQGNGLCVLDPHGDLIDGIVASVPKHRIDDVVLIDPSDSLYPIGFNILLAQSDVEKDLLASDLVAVFRKFSTSWGDQMNSVFANAILAFVYNKTQYHLGDLRRFLIENPYRTQILRTVTDPDITYYWTHEFPILKNSSIGSILTRLDAFLRPKVIRNMVCKNQTLDFAALMDSNKIVLVKLSQGLLGTENSYLLGAFIVAKLQQTAMSRQAQTAKARIPFFCYIDEFQHFITPSMASILSGARKYALGLILSHQDMQQVIKYDTEIASSVLANAGVRVYFRLGDSDAKRLEDGFSSFTAHDLQNLATGEAIARVNTTDADFNLSVIAFKAESDENYTSEIITSSRNKYSVSIQTNPVVDVPTEPAPEPQQVPPKKSARKTPVAEKPPIAKSEDVRQHRYLQMFVKAMAEAQGYKATLEVPTPDGNGQVDVLLEKAGQTIAVEISVTTTADWELHNIQKCLAAGYSQVVVCTTQQGKLKAIKALITAQLSKQEQARVQLIHRDDIPQMFQQAQQSTPSETVIKGYRVKVNYESNPTKQDLLTSIINAARK